MESLERWEAPLVPRTPGAFKEYLSHRPTGTGIAARPKQPAEPNARLSFDAG